MYRVLITTVYDSSGREKGGSVHTVVIAFNYAEHADDAVRAVNTNRPGTPVTQTALRLN